MIEKNNQNKEWYLFDAKDTILGRMSTNIADLLRGKKKTSFANNTDNGDYVIVVNAEKVALTGKKEEQKRYRKHTGYLGNMKETILKEMRRTKPEEIIRHSVAGMLPKNKLRDIFMSRLKVYSGASHPHKNVKIKNQ